MFSICKLLIEMNNTVLLSIGKKIREIRTSKKIKLIDLAASAQISKGLVSQIENGRTIPSLPVLFQIIKALEIDYPSFFEGIDNHSSNQIILKRKEEYSPIEKEEAIGFNYFSILAESIGNVALQFNILELKPEAQRNKVVTNGYTYLYILQGDIDYLLDDELVALHEGDSLFFNGTIPHVPQNNSNSIARILVLYMLSSEKSK